MVFIIRITASAATYYVKVIGFNGAFISTSCYNLTVNTSGRYLEAAN
ncbi:MAG: hypothetical protein IPK10_18670 [Bacteroidetes bacterium]|nr:hypothetical protein [Bacteroidota bacterium]